MPRPLPFNEAQARDAIGRARCWTEALAFLGYRNAGGNAGTVKKYAARWGISTDHFDPRAVMLEALERSRKNRNGLPLDEVLVRRSSYSRGHLKERLFQAGLKKRRCELCSQGERWRGRLMSLILDHINGVPDDNRLQNLRVVCPNCAATFDTHCGRNLPRQRECVGCGRTFPPRTIQQRYCSFPCFTGARTRNAGKPAPSSTFGIPQPDRRLVERPPYEQLIKEIEETSYVAVGRKYGVSDNSIRKWIRFHRREKERVEHEVAQAGEQGGT
ncbi:MAG TPA: hypothetical protein VN458_08090 [Solirubrobacterales bacterium]|nr:hypothetical protein [Solirubrobacterales bacterium]